MPAASSAGKSAADQSTLMPRPTTTLDSRPATDSASASTPPTLRRRPSRRATMSLGHLRASRSAPGPQHVRGCLEHGHGAHGRQSPGLRGRQARGAQTGRDEQRAPRRCQPGPAEASSTGGLLVGHRQADLCLPVGQPGAHHVLRRCHPREALQAGDGHCRPQGRAAQGSAAQASAASGSSRRNVRCTARAAASSSSSAMMQVMRISEVEIMLMLMPSSASAPNICAA